MINVNLIRRHACAASQVTIEVGAFCETFSMKPDLLQGNLLFLGRERDKILGGYTYKGIAGTANVTLTGRPVPECAITPIMGSVGYGNATPYLVLIFEPDGAPAPLLILASGQEASVVSSTSSGLRFSQALAKRKPPQGSPMKDVLVALKNFTVPRAEEVAAAAAAAAAGDSEATSGRRAGKRA